MSSIRLSVCPSVTLVDQHHISWKSWKLIARIISPTPSVTFAFRSLKAIHLLQGEHREISGRLEMGWEKVTCWSTKAAISLKRVKIEDKLLWKPIGSHQRCFEWYRPRPPTAFPSPRFGFATPTQNCNRYYLRNGKSYELQLLHAHS